MNDEIANKQKAIEDLNNEQNSFEQSRQIRIKELEMQIKTDKAIADEAQINIEQILAILDEIKSQIKDLSIKLGCDVTKIVEMLGGDGDRITERNLILYLSSLEQRVDELLSVKYFIEASVSLNVSLCNEPFKKIQTR